MKERVYEGGSSGERDWAKAYIVERGNRSTNSCMVYQPLVIAMEAMQLRVQGCFQDYLFACSIPVFSSSPANFR